VPTIRVSSALGIGATIANVLAGSQFEFLGRPSIVQVFNVADNIATSVPEIEVFFGQELQAPQAPCTLVAAGVGPNVPDDEIVNDIGAPGDRLVVRLVETGGLVAAVVRTMVKITPL
jgi:hypothetical protein